VDGVSQEGQTRWRADWNGGATAGGLIGGVLLGLIGTGVAVLAQSKPEPPIENLLAIEETSDDCQYAYIEAFNQVSLSKKRKAALQGGLIGTAVIGKRPVSRVFPRP
jgi:hypothetical protein